MKFKDDLKKYLDIDLSDKQIDQFQTYYEFLIEYNKNINLTSITEMDEVYYKHFFDSLTALKYIDFNDINSLCDMGSGAGFPSLPLKIIYPHLEITIIDSLNKRLLFLERLIDKLKFDQVILIHDRIENYALNHQNHFDFVTARALGDLSLISEMGLPMTKIEGHFLAYKGQNIEEELGKAISGIQKLGGKIETLYSFELPYEYGGRSLVYITKIKEVKNFPRNFQLMKNKPL